MGHMVSTAGSVPATAALGPGLAWAQVLSYLSGVSLTPDTLPLRLWTAMAQLRAPKVKAQTAVIQWGCLSRAALGHGVGKLRVSCTWLLEGSVG